MSVKILSQVWDHSKASGTPLLVLLSLADYADDDGECWPSIAAIGRKCRLKDERHVKRVIHDILERELGEVVVIPCGGKSSSKGGLRSNRYRIVVHLPETMAEQPLSEWDDGGSLTTIASPDSGSPTTPIVVGQPPSMVVHQPPESSCEPSRKPSERARSVPDHLPLTDELLKWAARQPFLRTVDLSRECEAFLDHHRAKGTRVVDWEAHFRTWLRRVETFGGRERPPNIHDAGDELAPTWETGDRERRIAAFPTAPAVFPLSETDARGVAEREFCGDPEAVALAMGGWRRAHEARESVHA